MSAIPTTVPTVPGATDVPATTDVPIGTTVTAVPATPATLGFAPTAKQASNPAHVEEATQVLNVFDTPSHTSGEQVGEHLDVPEPGTTNPGSPTSPKVTEPFSVMQTSIQKKEQQRLLDEKQDEEDRLELKALLEAQDKLRSSSTSNELQRTTKD